MVLRLEFLGDACVGLLVCEHLFTKLGGRSGERVWDEGAMSRLKDALVSNQFLGRRLAHRLQRVGLSLDEVVLTTQDRIKDNLQRWHAQDRQRPRANSPEELATLVYCQPRRVPYAPELPKVAADMYEAIVGAMLIDSDYDTARVWRQCLRSDFDLDLAPALALPGFNMDDNDNFAEYM